MSTAPRLHERQQRLERRLRFSVGKQGFELPASQVLLEREAGLDGLGKHLFGEGDLEFADGIEQPFRAVEIVAVVGVDADDELGPGVVANDFQDFDIAAISLGARHPLIATADFDLHRPVAGCQGHVDLFTKTILPTIGILWQQIGEIDGAVVHLDPLGPGAAEQFVGRLVEQLAGQIPQRHRAGAQGAVDGAVLGGEVLEGTLTDELRRGFARHAAVAQALDARIGIEPYQAVVGRVAVDVEPGILASQLRAPAGDFEGHDACDPHVARQLAGPGPAGNPGPTCGG